MTVVSDPPVATRTDAAVELRGVAKSYGGANVVHDLDLAVEPGAFFSLLGPSGCGKTTTLRMVGGFVDPTRGAVLLHGQDVTEQPPHRRDVNTVFQSYALFDHLSIWDNVAFGLRRRRVPRAEVRRRVGEVLELVQLTGRDKDKPRSLSGGQRQRVALARALVNRPSVLLLDEPLAALDLKLRRTMQVELKKIQREVGITFVFVTHDQDEALTMSDAVAVMCEGQVHQVGTPEDVYERPATAFVAGFIGTANQMTGAYRDGVLMLPGAVALRTGPLAGVADGSQVTVAVRPEKIWLSELTPDMVQTDGLVKATVYGGATTTYLLEVADGVELAVLEQNTDRSRTEERWHDGERVRLGWRPEHCLVLP
ncbi:ABC transporter ATP-binding protein [Nocardioides anomalus]|uniref:Spermidine/putrescine import ATP-binding protein PotA n=1 Tax=Nocardioides anomalus TaxID=2712223 RepID=A0A6G6W9Z6_9ACTN|nr:ABC transporter ATP-binding protein [Nocardioides anomalus]QIG41925.1 ABC transporter ATP-binding protein [Nocardioides anomalus]